MGHILGLGISHYPPYSGHDADMATILRNRLKDPDIPAHVKNEANWPALMQQEWSTDFGAAAAAKHRAAMLTGLRKVKQALVEFNPDFILIWGDDQYENFKEDLVPAFTVQAYDDMHVFPWRQAAESAMMGQGRPNVWGESAQTQRLIKGHRQGAKYLASQLLQSDFDVAYSYQPLHHKGLAHAFLNAILYLDHDRLGFDWPVVPLAINCYGRRVISFKGFASAWADRDRELDPPSPSPRRCFDLGAATARILRDSPWKVAVLASSSWSHAFLVDKTYRMKPDIASDKMLYEAMRSGDYSLWRNWPLDRLEVAGQQEVLNWFSLVGAMNELGSRVQWSEFVETYVFNSSKVAAIFETRG
jgi:hypothetical protein